MHVLLTMHDMAGVGGTERSVQMLHDGLLSRGHEVTLLHGGPRLPDPDLRQLSLPALSDEGPFFEDRDYRAQRRELLAYCRDERVELAHVHGFLRGRATADLQRALPVVMSLHTQTCPNGTRYQWATQQVCERSIGLGCITKGFTELGCGHLANGDRFGLPGFARGGARALARLRDATRSAGVIVPSAYLRRRLGDDGVPVEHISVVHPPVATAFSTISLNPLPPHNRRHGARLPLVTFAGRLIAPKGPEVALAASARVSIPHTLAIAGEGPLRGRLEQLAVDLGVHDRVLFLGALDHDELAALFRRSAVVVAPSLMPETFGMVGPEAVAAGTPAVVTGAGGAPEWLTVAGDMAREVPRADAAALASAVEHYLRSRPSGAQVGAVRAQFSAEQHVEKTLVAYRRAGARRGTNSDEGAPAPSASHHR